MYTTNNHTRRVKISLSKRRRRCSFSANIFYLNKPGNHRQIVHQKAFTFVMDQRKKNGNHLWVTHNAIDFYQCAYV